MNLLIVSHQRQKQQADCLAACAAMLLDYFQISIDYEKLTRMLGVDAIGTPFRNLHRLQPLGVSVVIAEGSVEAK